MSKESNRFEAEIVNNVQKYVGHNLPTKLPIWLVNEGVIPGARIIGVRGIGSLSRYNKTDVIIYLYGSEPIKISAKLKNAHYFGNWYCHSRFLDEFGKNAFSRMTEASTRFANYWMGKKDTPFVGVSLSFGHRTGETGEDFSRIFVTADLITVARGYSGGEAQANCMYIENRCANTIEGIIRGLQPINAETVNAATGGFKVIHRPVNPITEYSNRGKCSYTRFMPYKALDAPTVIRDARTLFSLGQFVPVEPDSINHNRILNELEYYYNIIVPRKPKRK